MSIFWIMFWKALILSLYAQYKDKKEQTGVDPLLAVFNREWSKRRASQPLLLTDQRAKLSD